MAPTATRSKARFVPQVRRKACMGWSWAAACGVQVLGHIVAASHLQFVNVCFLTRFCKDVFCKSFFFSLCLFCRCFSFSFFCGAVSWRIKIYTIIFISYRFSLPINSTSNNSKSTEFQKAHNLTTVPVKEKQMTMVIRSLCS